MSNNFDAVAQVYEFLQVSSIISLLDGRIYQGKFPSHGEVIGEGKDRFIVINCLPNRIGQLIKEVPININVFVKVLEENMDDDSTLDILDKAIDAALDSRGGDKLIGYSDVEKIFSTVLPENPYGSSHSLMLIRINLIINTK